MPGLVVQALAHAEGGAGEDATDDAAEIRFGLTASRKVGGAVARNRARRRLRALAREILPIAGRPGTDYVLIARAETLNRPHAALRADLERALARLARPRRRPAAAQGRQERPRRPDGRG